MQATSNKQQATNNKQQVTSNKQQTPSKQTASLLPRIISLKKLSRASLCIAKTFNRLSIGNTQEHICELIYTVRSV